MGMIARKAAALLALIAGFNATRKAQNIATATVYGEATLDSGTVTVPVTGVTALSVVSLALKTPGGTTGTNYKVVPSADQFIITAVGTNGATVTTDTSVLLYKVDTPLFHFDQTPQTSTGDASDPATTNLTISAASATNLATSITLYNQMRQVYIQHAADAVGHVAADETNALEEDSLTSASLEADVVDAANDLKAKWNLHLAESGVHTMDDTVNNVATSDATDQTSANTLLNAIKTAMNAHLASAPAGDSITIVGP